MVGALLTGEGYEVTETPSGVEAVARVKDGEPDVALVDLMMPGDLDGMATLARLRDVAPDLPVIMMSGRAGLADAVVAACEKVGFTPRIGQHTPQLSSTINLVAASLGISVVPDCMRQLRPQGVKYLRLTGERPQALLGIAHRLNERSPVVLNFSEIAKQLGADQKTSGIKTAGTGPAVSGKRASQP